MNDYMRVHICGHGGPHYYKFVQPIKLVQTIDTYHTCKRSYAYIYIFKPTYLPWGALVGDCFPDKDEESLLP